MKVYSIMLLLLSVSALDKDDRGSLEPRKCYHCGAEKVKYGVTAARLSENVNHSQPLFDQGNSSNYDWLALFCRSCAKTRSYKDDVCFSAALETLTKKCRRCSRRASFGRAEGVARHCRSHRSMGEIDIANRGKLCMMPNCTTLARYRKKTGERRRFCWIHSNPGEIKISSQQCHHPEGCLKYPSFGLSNGSACFCKLHKSIAHVNIRRSMKEKDVSNTSWRAVKS
ncbi:hypothetical protein GUITHDRAFT_110726 [Guillardia theta CCMP2712]|uniref:C2H2-type domain-containing protein n=1 Tax=Guillardia theta (strain CCMP2712) TaxID=905079 RepID=L1J5G6_GUITC|nr:hypothetical protein GUITHDRAFT_110726 [Guillardia theta CCMP2712]EKX43310.1 hypothetical protein GUITHDRAFT_110726 [Guillardia theta CCMP2712]|eukprot:XP_005830290.1 hypothetical protein GUITHDRAFT_110726 [Guillardia theta CCMP2712]